MTLHPPENRAEFHDRDFLEAVYRALHLTTTARQAPATAAHEHWPLLEAWSAVLSGSVEIAASVLPDDLLDAL